jgi:hypothetical protein
MAEEKFNYHTSYKVLFRVRPVLYRFGDVPLPIPVRLESLIVFAAAFVLLYPLCVLAEPVTRAVLHFNRLVSDAVFSGLIAYYSQNVDPAGKFLPVYIYDIMSHFIKSRRMWLGGPIESKGGRIYETFAVLVFSGLNPENGGRKVRLKKRLRR